MGKGDEPTNVSKSICEAALERYSLADDSLAKLIREASIEVRDFMLLSFVCDQVCMSMEQISRALGLDRSVSQQCIDRLIKAGLLQYEDVDGGVDDNAQVYATSSGYRVCKHILGDSG